MVRRGRATTRRLPASGWTQTKIEQVPCRTYSESSLRSCPGGGGDRITGVREELVGLLVHAHHRHLGVIRSGVDVATSSIRAANSPLAVGGMVQHFFR